MESQVLSLVDDFIDIMIELQNADPNQEEALYASAEQQLLTLADKALLLLGGREEYLEAMLNQLITQKLPQEAVMESFGDFKQEVEQLVSRSMDAYREKKLEPEEASDMSIVAPDAEDAYIVEEKNLAIVKEEIDVDKSGTELSEEAENADSFSEEEITVADMSLEEEALPDEEDGGIQGEEAFAFVEEWEESEEVQVEEPLGFLINSAFPGEEILSQYKFADIVFDYYIPSYTLAFYNGSEEMISLSSFNELALRKSGITVICIDPARIYNIKAFKRDILRIISEKSLEEKRVFDLYAE